MTLTRWVTAALCCAALAASGCTTTRTLTPQSAPLTETSFEAGDRVRVTLLDGTQADITVERVDAASIVGTDSDGVRHTFDTTDIASVTTKIPSPGKTAAAVGMTAAGIYAVVAIVTAVGAAALLGGG